MSYLTLEELENIAFVLRGIGSAEARESAKMLIDREIRLKKMNLAEGGFFEGHDTKVRREGTPDKDIP